jgi:hypothetical protein
MNFFPYSCTVEVNFGEYVVTKYWNVFIKETFTPKQRGELLLIWAKIILIMITAVINKRKVIH